MRHACALVGHLIARIMFHPDGVPFFPTYQMEDFVEGFFGGSKEFTRGTASAKDILYGSHIVHRKAVEAGPPLVYKWPEFKPLSALAMAAIAETALRTACVIANLMSVNKSSIDARKAQLKAWYSARGKALLTSKAHAATAADAAMEAAADEREVGWHGLAHAHAGC